EIEHRPGLHLVLADRQLRHTVAIRRARALGALAVEPNVDGLFVQLELTLDEFLTTFDEVGFVGHYLMCAGAPAAVAAPSRRCFARSFQLRGVGPSDDDAGRTEQLVADRVAL